MTKEMYEKCLNENMVIFGKLPKDVKDAMKSCEKIQILDGACSWVSVHDPRWCLNFVYRTDPSTPYDQEFEEDERVTIAKSEYDRLLKTRLDAMHFFGAFEVAEKSGEKDQMLRIATEFARKIEV